MIARNPRAPGLLSSRVYCFCCKQTLVVGIWKQTLVGDGRDLFREDPGGRVCLCWKQTLLGGWYSEDPGGRVCLC